MLSQVPTLGFYGSGFKGLGFLGFGVWVPGFRVRGFGFGAWAWAQGLKVRLNPKP